MAGKKKKPTQTKNNELEAIKGLEYLKQSLAFIEIRVPQDILSFSEKPVIHQPQALLEDSKQFEFVYSILDYGNCLMTSKVMEHLFSGQSMLKMYYTIDKMVSILHQKIKNKEDETGETFPEISVELWGYELCLRKAFEVIINLPDNWIITNYEPGDWGNHYLDILQKLAEKGFPYPPPAPRDYYRHHLSGDLKKTSSLK